MRISAARYSDGELHLKCEAKDGMQTAYKFKAGDYDIVPHKEKRSLTANGYCWKLCDLIAEAIHSTKDDIYRDAVRAVGIYQDFPGLMPDKARTLITAWGRQGVGWIAEQVDYEPDGERVIMRGYYGSSVYNVRQMSRLINWLVDEAQTLGLETKPEEEVKSLLSQWEAKQ